MKSKINGFDEWFKKPSVVYGYEDTLMAYRISKVLNIVLFIGILLCIWFMSKSQGMVYNLKSIIFSKNDVIVQMQEELANKQSEIEKLQIRIEELESINNSAQDIQNYIKSYNPTVPKVVAAEIANVIIQKAQEHSVPVPAVVGTMEVESNFDPYAISSKGARGLLQVMYKVWHKKLSLQSPFELHDIEKGIDSGCRILRIYLDETDNNMKKALYKYVGGDSTYGKRVYEAMGKYVIFRSFSKMKPEPQSPTDPEVVDDDPKKIDMVYNKNENTIEIKPKTEQLIHEIKFQGETLGIIAQWYTGNDDNWKEIMKVNPDLVPEKLMIGQKILIPDNIVTNRTPLSKEFVNKTL